MPRPLKYGTPTVRHTLFLHPDSGPELRRRAAENQCSEGEVIDRLLRGPSVGEVMNDLAPAARKRRIDIMGHDWGEAQGKFGRPCNRCGLYDKTEAAQDPCPGKKEGA